MFKQAGFTKGEYDGREDALSGKRYRPKPDLALSVVSKGYQDCYLNAYYQAFHHAKRALIQQDVREQHLYAERAKALRDQRSRSRELRDSQADQGREI